MRPLSSRFSALPADQGLYRSADEHDACGVAMVATTRGTPGHDIVSLAITALENLDHRGAVGAEENTGDGAGILLQLPDRFLRAVIDAELPAPGEYAAGLAFLPQDDEERESTLRRIETIAVEEGLCCAPGLMQASLSVTVPG
ncbi:hypothetical protein JSY14_00450 [Brachybacterium sp. EF45031]|uniref:hypothetical protein n=1 Tax=Brachybacterium sillae TaxID=2810536 RepID=UPI003D813E0F|nr:hypothetical protein [Brachybacterium sillae]